MYVDDRNDTTQNGTSDLKRRYAAGYEIDAELVAREILRKLRLVRWAREELVSGPGRTPAPSVRGR